MGTTDGELAGRAWLTTTWPRCCLEIRDLHAWYGESHVLHGVDLDVRRGEVVTLLGRNGAGRTTHAARDPRPGRPRARARSSVDGVETIDDADAPHRAPGHRLLPRGARHLRQPDAARRTCCCRRASRRGRHERRRDLRDVSQPARARATARARGCRAASSRCSRWRASCAPARNLLLLDEISEGLAPVIVQALGAHDPHAQERGFTIVMVEQNFRFAAPLADRFYVMEHGKIVEAFAAARAGSRRRTCCTSTWACEALAID